MTEYKPPWDFQLRYMAALEQGRMLDWISTEVSECHEVSRQDLLWVIGALAYVVDGHWRPKPMSIG